MRLFLLTVCIVTSFLFSCKKDEPLTSSANLIFRFVFDSTQVRLNNLGQASALPTGHAGQNPIMKGMSAHYLELAQGPLTPLGAGMILYKAPETNQGGAQAIDFNQATIKGQNEVFFTIPIKDVTPGSYEYIRLSLAYQSYDIYLHIDTIIDAGTAMIPVKENIPCRVAAFVGYNTFIKNLDLKSKTIPVNGNRAQGFWAFESSGSILGFPFSHVASGQAPPGATTVVNPLASTSPIPAGSCVVTGAFQPGKLNITGKESKDIQIDVSLSTNHSFEWVDTKADGLWEPAKGEPIIDMGLRGVIPYIK